jgi:peptidoglycan/xylan/chitin deacetylase (PgdA/CDA1 family)
MGDGRMQGTLIKFKPSLGIPNRSELDRSENSIDSVHAMENKECTGFRIKRFVSGIFELLKLNDLLLFIQKRGVSGGKFIRAINYHCIPSIFETQFEKQLQFYKKYFSDVNEDDLNDFLFQKKWNKKKPGIIISFDDGDLSNYSLAAPLLEKYGFTGWFFIPTSYSRCDPSLQRKFAARHSITYCETGNPRIAVSLNELRDLVKRGHVIGSHTQHHCRFHSIIDRNVLNDEIIGSKEVLGHTVGRKISAFSWVGGESDSYSSQAAHLISEAGYQFSFMTNSSPILFNTNSLQLQRTNIEASWSESLVKFQLSGLMDLAYFYKRRRINLLTKVVSSSKSPVADKGNSIE